MTVRHRPLRLSVVALAIASGLAPPIASAQVAPADIANDTAAAYCTNLADAASDARYARKLAHLRAVEERIDERLEALEKKRAEYEEWLGKRERFLSLADDGLISIYAGMRAEAASEQLAAMDEVTAAAIIARVQPRIAAGILAEMATDKAARLATIVAGMSRTKGRAS